MKTLGKFLEKHFACEYGLEFTNDLACGYGLEFTEDITLDEFLATCSHGDWILWLFAKTNPDNLKELTLAKGHCANTVRHLMKDHRSILAVDTAIAFGEGRATRKELDLAATVASHAAKWSASAVAIHTAYAASSDHVSNYSADAAKKANKKLTADICRQYLPLEIWDQSKL